MFSRLWPVMRKEFIHIRRDPRTLAVMFVAPLMQAKAVDMQVERRSPLAPLEVRTRVWYNPDMASAVFMIPGLIGLVLQLQATLLTSSAIVREREHGTIEQLIITPTDRACNSAVPQAT